MLRRLQRAKVSRVPFSRSFSSDPPAGDNEGADELQVRQSRFSPQFQAGINRIGWVILPEKLESTMTKIRKGISHLPIHLTRSYLSGKDLVVHGYEKKQLHLDVQRLNEAAKTSGLGLPFHQLKKWAKQGLHMDQNHAERRNEDKCMYIQSIN
jgi:hypothetical protein